jgi:POT family proton-dependent oligopeptide transporter
MGINVGAGMGSILVGYLGQTIGWAYGFGLAGIGMVLGVVIFVIGRPALRGRGEPPAPLARAREWLLYVVGVAAVGAIWLLIQYQNIVGTLLGVAGLALLLYVLYEAFKLPRDARDRILAIIFLLVLQPVFGGLFEQAGASINLVTDRYVERGGVPASLFQSINAIYIVLLGPVFAALWVRLAKRGLEPSTPAKFGLGLIQAGLSFLVLVWGTHALGGMMVPVVLIFLLYLLQTTGELCLSPVGLSAMNRLAPRFMASLIMGAWFFATAGGNFVAGKIGEMIGGESGEMTKEASLAMYTRIGWIGFGIGVAVLAVSPFVKRLMHLDRLRDEDAGDDLLGRKEAGLENQEAGTHPAARPR